MQDNRDAVCRQGASPQESSLPFFARFLEGQHEAGLSAATTKYPSDLDEYTTNKYPSDGDDDTPASDRFMPASAPGAMSAATLKYPSDRDEWDGYFNS